MNRSKTFAALLLSSVAVISFAGCQQAPPPAAPAPTVIVEHPDHHDADRAAGDRQAAADRQAAEDRAAADRAHHDDRREPPPPQPPH